MPIEVRHPSDIEKAYEQVGRNDKLGLTGKPPGPLKSLSTSRIYRLGGKTIVCLSQLFMQREFYLTYDMDFLVARFKSELAYIHRHWAQAGRPTVTVFLTHSLLESGLDVFLELMHQIRSGEVDGVPVKAGSLTRLMPAASHERIDFLHDYRFSEALLRPGVGQTVLVDRKTIQGALNPTAELEIELENDPVVLLKRLEGTANLYEQIEVTTAVVAMLSLDAEVRVFGRLVSLRKILEEIYEEAGRRRFWAVVRRAASLLGMVEFNLTDSVNAILVRQKAILLGKSYTTDSLVVRPLLPSELLEKINTYCREDIRDRVLMQEVLVYLGQLIRARPELFEELLTIRVSYLILLLTGEIAREYHVTQDEAYNQLMHLAPSEIQRRLKVVMEHYHTMGFVIDQLESLPAHSAGQPLTWTQDMGLEVLKPPKGGWRTWRQYGGILSHVPQAFYPKVWKLFEHTRGMVIGDKLDRKNRLDSSVILSDMTPGEKAFALRIEHLLNKIPAPEYRQLTLEALSVLSSFSEQNQTLLIDDYIVLDVLIGHSVRIAYLTHYPQFADEYDEHKADAWDFFYDSSPLASTEFMIQAFKYLLDCSAPAPAQSLESVEA
jgi:phosphorylase kinase alpha/beta subunit